MYNIHFIPIFIGDHLLQPAVVYNPDCTSRYWTQNPFTVISVLQGQRRTLTYQITVPVPLPNFEKKTLINVL